jgi:hypothetical protein
MTAERDEQAKQAYRDAYDRWQRDLLRLHALLLDGESLEPLRRVALLRSESHSHDRYEEMRRRFLGLDPISPDAPPSAREEPPNA